MDWKLPIILLLTLGHGFRMLLHFVEYRSANNPTPANVADVYDEETYLRWKRYSAENCRLGIISTAVTYVVVLLLLLTNSYAAFASLFPANVYLQLMAVIIFDLIVGMVVGVVFDYIGTMKIEQKYGFNRTELKTFITDQLRNLVIGLILNLLLVFILAFLYRSMGDWMIILFAAALFLLTLVISFLYPIFSRLGNKFEPLAEGDLKDRLMGLLTKHGYKVKAIEVMDASRRTTKLNAYFTGFGKMKTIVLYDNLVNTMSADEICAVFSHELGHGLHKDVLKQQIMNLGNMLIMAVLVWIAVREPSMHTSFGFTEVNYGFAYVLLTIALGIVQPLTGMITSAYSRFAEYRADRQAVKEGYGKALVSGLKLLAKENFAHLSPSPILVVIDYSHPPLSQRIEAIEKAVEN